MLVLNSHTKPTCNRPSMVCFQSLKLMLNIKAYLANRTLKHLFVCAVSISFSWLVLDQTKETIFHSRHHTKMLNLCQEHQPVKFCKRFSLYTLLKNDRLFVLKRIVHQKWQFCHHLLMLFQTCLCLCFFCKTQKIFWIMLVAKPFCAHWLQVCHFF